MASTAEIQKIMSEIKRVHLERVYKKLNDTAVGISAALRILFEQGGSITSGRLGELLGVSTARVAVLLKSMESKGLITKEKNVLDARVTVVNLTAFGNETIHNMREELYKQINRVIDHVGFERLLEFFAITREIAEVMGPPKVMF